MDDLGSMGKSAKWWPNSVRSSNESNASICCVVWWCRMVWCGMVVWCGVVWCGGVEWCGVVV